MLIWGNALHGQRSSVDPKMPCIEHLMVITSRQIIQIPLYRVVSMVRYSTSHLDIFSV